MRRLTGWPITLRPERSAADEAFLQGHQDPDSRQSAGQIIATETRERRLGPIFTAAFLGSLGLSDEAYVLIDELEQKGRQLNLRGIWWHSNREARMDPRLTVVARRRGMIDYWREFGPPDNCNLDAENVLACFR